MYCVRSKVWSHHLKEKTLITCTTLVRHLLAASITSKFALKVTSKKLRWGAKVPPYLPFLPSRLFLRLNLLKGSKRPRNINWHRWNWLFKINTEISGRIGGNLHLKERKQYKQRWWFKCLKRKNSLSNNFTKIAFRFHTNITSINSERYFGLSLIQTNPLLLSNPIDNSSQKATRFRLLFCVVTYFLSRLQTPSFTPQNTSSLLFFLNAKHFLFDNWLNSCKNLNWKGKSWLLYSSK